MPTLTGCEHPSSRGCKVSASHFYIGAVGEEGVLQLEQPPPS